MNRSSISLLNVYDADCLELRRLSKNKITDIADLTPALSVKCC